MKLSNEIETLVENCDCNQGRNVYDMEVMFQTHNVTTYCLFGNSAGNLTSQLYRVLSLRID